MLVSILIPTLHERRETYSKLVTGLQKQIDDNNLGEKVEILSICDGRNIPLTMKRNMLQKMSNGKYFTHLDDDDELAEDYCRIIVDHIEALDKSRHYDVIGYNQLAKVQGGRFIVKPHMEADLSLHPVGNQYNADMTVKKGVLPEFFRYPWQYCLWHQCYKTVHRTDSDTNAREDRNWIKKLLLEYPKTMSYCDFIGHTYNFDDPSLSTCQN